ncbi:hypothetical protein MtrunA17_Chr3g0126711 [Medicago truncatula]|uniref:Transmembrane protein n=1 Tax=Medicago truncatula TaxID=3880 RepID=A0A396IY45_MEDTR|nr:hypothetical protein MtrunA17_Chr3g0126711 [Medicago truncatula]
MIDQQSNTQECVLCLCNVIVLGMKIIPFLLLEYSYVQRGPIHVCQIYQSKPVHFRSSGIIKCTATKVRNKPLKQII